MFKSILLAGFVWATANVMPQSPVSPPTAVAATFAADKVPAPVLIASVSHSLPHSRYTWELPAPAVSEAESAAAAEEAFVGRINAERTERGLSALEIDPMLTQTALAHSREMCAENYFDHQSPTPGMASPLDRYLTALKETGGSQPSYLLVGENIYYCSVFNDIYNVDYAHRALMASPDHRANILEPRFAKVGVGVYRNFAGEFWVTEMFSRDQTP